MKLNSHQFKWFFLGLSFVFLISCKATTRRPNIIFIMSDDHSVGATSAYGKSLMPTPNIDKLANQGMRFTNCFNVVSLCGPSRASILSGRYSKKNGYIYNGDTFDGQQETFPKLLQQAGYETAVIGKWHLRSEPTGFDHYKILPNQGAYFDPRLKDPSQKWEDGKKGGIVKKGYTTDIITDESIDWLKKRNIEKPFCLLVQHKSPHGPYDYPERYNHILADAPLPEPENFYDQYDGRNASLIDTDQLYSRLSHIHPAHLQEEIPDGIEKGTLAYQKWTYQKVFKGYYRLVASLDENVGRLMDFVDQSGLDENTIVIYTSDNGWFMGDHGLFNKMWMYEESLHVPLIVRYPGIVKPASVSDDFVSVLDFGPTFLDYAGIEKHPDFQGQSIKPLLSETRPDDWRSAHYYHYFGQYAVPAHCGIRTKDYKLIHFYKAEKEPKWELFDVNADPKEMVNLLRENKHNDVFEQLKTLMEEQQKTYEGVFQSAQPAVNL